MSLSRPSHPGLVDTGIVDAISPWLMAPLLPMVRRLLLTPEQGAESVVRLATDPAPLGVTGVHFRRHQEVPTPAASRDRQLQERIWAASAQLVYSSSRHGQPRKPGDGNADLENLRRGVSLSGGPSAARRDVSDSG